ncbi:MAG: DUF3857 domain-containing transglutaminase family protein [Armatimonadota bacterium]
MTNYCSIILLVLFLLFPLLAPAAPLTDVDLKVLLQDSPTAKDFPRDSAVWLRREMEITISPNGGTVTREHHLLKLLTAQALALANWEIPYDKSCETLEVRTVRTLINEQSYPVDPALMAESALYPGMAWYDSLVVRRFPLPAAMPGAVLDVDTVITRPIPRLPGEFSTRLHLQQPYPVREAYYTVRAPAAMPLTFRFTTEQAPKVTETMDGEQRVYRWLVQNMPALRLDEAQIPPFPDLSPSVRICSLGSWKPVADWYRGIAAGKDAVTPELRGAAARLVFGCATPQEKMASLHRAVSELPYVALEMGTLSDIPHPAAEVMKRNYGDCKDKATLLKALLSAVGIESAYVLVRTADSGALDRQQYSPAEFNHVILCVKLENGDHFLDPTLAGVPWTELPPNVDGAEGLILRGDGELVTLPAATAERNRTDIRVKVTVNADGSATGKATIAFLGQMGMLQRGMLLPVPPARYREALEGTLAPRLGSEVVINELKVDSLQNPALPLVITVDFTSPAYLQDAGPNRSGTLPVFTYQPNAFRTVRERVLPFQARMATSIHLEAVITLPEGVKVVSTPEPVKFEGPLGRYKDTTVIDGQILIYTCDMAAHRVTLPPSELEALRAWNAILALEKRNGLQFFVNK